MLPTIKQINNKRPISSINNSQKDLPIQFNLKSSSIQLKDAPNSTHPSRVTSNKNLKSISSTRNSQLSQPKQGDLVELQQYVEYITQKYNDLKSQKRKILEISSISDMSFSIIVKKKNIKTEKNVFSKLNIKNEVEHIFKPSNFIKKDSNDINRKDSLLSLLEKQNSSFNILKTKVSNTYKEVNIQTDDLSELAYLKNHIKLLDDEIIRLKGRINEYSKENEGLLLKIDLMKVEASEHSKVNQIVHVIQKEVKDDKEKEGLVREIKEKNREIETLTKEIKQLHMKINEMERKLEERKLDERSLIDEENIKIKEMNENLNSLNISINNKYQANQLEMTEKNKVIEELKLRISELESQINHSHNRTNSHHNGNINHTNVETSILNQSQLNNSIHPKQEEMIFIKSIIDKVNSNYNEILIKFSKFQSKTEFLLMEIQKKVGKIEEESMKFKSFITKLKTKSDTKNEIFNKEVYLKSEFERKNNNLHYQNKSLMSKINEVNSQISQLKSYKAEVDEKIRQVTIENSGLGKVIEERNEEIISLNKKIKRLEADLDFADYHFNESSKVKSSLNVKKMTFKSSVDY